MKLIFKWIALWTGRNSHLTPEAVIIEQMNEKRPLPLGMSDFETWSDRIISGSLLPAYPEDQKYALATMLMHLGPTVDHETDGYFIKSLRKAAVNQVAHAKMQAIYEKRKADKAKEEAAKTTEQPITEEITASETEAQH